MHTEVVLATPVSRTIELTLTGALSVEKSAVLSHDNYKQKMFFNSNKTYIIKKLKENAINI